MHRDIKPANVLFDESGHAYLTDFGVATMRDATSGLTATELVIGTPEFMAPEQARGERATPASDVFSLGATLRYAATGTPPYGRGDARVILNRAAEGKLDRLPPELPAGDARPARPAARQASRAPTDGGRSRPGRGRRHHRPPATFAAPATGPTIPLILVPAAPYPSPAGDADGGLSAVADDRGDRRGRARRRGGHRGRGGAQPIRRRADPTRPPP